MPLVPEFHWCQSLVPVGFNIAHVLFVCRQLTPETGTGYWYQKTGQCVWSLTLVMCVCISEWWCGEYCAVMLVSTLLIVCCLITSSLYIIRRRQVSKRPHTHSGLSAEYAFAAASVQYTAATSADSGTMHAGTSAPAAPPGDWYQQQLAALLQASSVHNVV